VDVVLSVTEALLRRVTTTSSNDLSSGELPDTAWLEGAQQQLVWSLAAVGSLAQSPPLAAR
jgi:hypothetical protein